MDRETVERQIDELSQLLEEIDAENETDYSSGDMVQFSYEGEERFGQIENVSGEQANVRVMAVSGDDFEPTDKVLELNVSELSTLGSDGDEEPEESDNEPEEIEEEVEEEEEEDDDEKSITAHMFVSWNSKDGLTKGRVVSVSNTVTIPDIEEEIKSETPLALIHVYQEKDGWEETGVHVAHSLKDLSVIDPLEEKDAKLMIKMKSHEIKEEDGIEGQKIGRISGLGSSYGKVDLGGDTVERGAYNQTLEHNNNKIQLMFDHGYKVSDYAGIAELKSTDEGLVMDAKMPLNIPHVKDAFDMIKFLIGEGKSPGLSIGYRPIKYYYKDDGTRVLQEIALDELSVTPYPMDTHARIRDAKNRKITYHSKRSLWQSLRKTKTAKSDAPTGNQQDEGDYQSLCSVLKEITN